MLVEVDSLVSGTELEGWVKGEVGELWAERYRLLDDFRFPKSEGSDKLAIALFVLSRANVAARLNSEEGRFFEELVDKTD